MTDKADEQAPLPPGNSDVSVMYINGFGLMQSNSDVTVLGNINGRPNLELHMSFTLAKTLAELLGGLMAQLEEHADTKIQTTKQIDAAMQKEREAK